MEEGRDEAKRELLARRRQDKVKGALTVFAGFLMNMVRAPQAAGSVNAWGTISVYVASYYHHFDSNVDLGTMFVVYPVSAFFEGVGFSNAHTVMGVIMYHAVGSRVTGAAAGLTYALTFLACAYIPNAYLFAGVYGVMTGVATGLSTFTPVWPAWEFFPKNQGLVAGLIVFGYGLSPALFGIGFTYLINPTNKPATLEVSRGATHDRLFTYDVAQHLPYALRVMSLVFAVLYIVSVPLLFKASNKKKLGVQDSISSLMSQNVRRNVRECPDMATVLRSQAFWVLLLGLFVGSSYGIYIINAYKNFGMLHIHNDRTLSLIGSIASVANAFGRMLLPIILDYVSFKVSYCVNSVAQIVVAATLALTVTNQYWYCLWISLSFVLFAGNFTGFAIEAGRIFGPK